MARGASGCLDEGGLTAQEPLLVGVQHRDKGHFRQVETFAQEVDADQAVEIGLAQAAQDAHAVEGGDVGMEVFRTDADILQIGGQVLGGFLRQGGDQHAFLALGAFPDLIDQVIDE